MICPKCGFDQPDDIYCVFCGVNIERHQNEKKKRRNKGVILATITVVVALSIGAYLFFSGKAVSPDRTAETRHARQLAQLAEKKDPGLKSRQSGDVGEGEGQRRTRRGPQSKTSREFSKASSPEDRQLRDLEPSPRSSLPRDSEKSPSGDDEEEIGTASQWFEKGQALDDDSDAEMECYDKAIELDPKLAPAYYRLGAIYYRHANYELADQQFAKFVEHASEADWEAYDIYVYYSLSDVERLSGRIEEEAAAEKGEEKTPPETETEAEIEAEIEPAGSEKPSEEASDEVMTVVRFSTVDGHVIVPVVLNDYFQAKVMVDTGSGITIVSRSLARDLGLTEQENHPITLKTIGKDVQGQLATLDSVQIGHLSRHGFPVAIADLPLGKEGRFDGILGMDFMNSYIIHIDNEQQKITLTTKAQ